MGRGGYRKNAGRKSAFKEQADAAALWAMFDDATKIADIRKRVESGVFSVRDVMQLKMLGGNERLIAEVFKKLFPDLEKVDHSGGINITVKDYSGKDGEKK